MGRIAQGLRNYYMPYLCSVPRQAQTTARKRPSNVPG
jgi:hypothetical protein